MEADVYNKPAQYYTLLTCRLSLNHWNFRDFRIIDEFLILNIYCEICVIPAIFVFDNWIYSVKKCFCLLSSLIG